jgi:hypothetical protein
VGFARLDQVICTKPRPYFHSPITQCKTARKKFKRW